MPTATVLAVDLGATSGRVIAVELDGDRVRSRLVRKFTNSAITATDGSLRWDWDRLVNEVRQGIVEALEQEPVSSIAIDAWGVDYGLLDEHGQLIDLPFSHRDARTAGWQSVVDRIGRERIYQITGTQFMAPNTLCQLAAHDQDQLGRARSLVFLPELMIHALTGAVVAERTEASTTQLFDIRQGQWSYELIAELGIRSALFPPVFPANHVAGNFRGVPLQLVGDHDTASAVVSVPATRASQSAYISSGTWSLVGVELPEPILSAKARDANFTNELGAFGSVRFLKNVMGLWMFDRCRKAWGMDAESAMAAAAAAASDGPTIDAFDQRFMSPRNMEQAIRGAAPGLSGGRPELLRCVLESLARAYACVLTDLEKLTGSRPEVVHVVGGGSRIDLLNQLTADRSCLPVVAGPVEATALGNAIAQFIGLGLVRDQDEGRELIRASFELGYYEPRTEAAVNGSGASA